MYWCAWCARMIITIYILYRYPSLPAESWRAQRGETPSFLKKHFYYHLNPAFSSLRFAYNFVKRPKQSIKLDFILYVGMYSGLW